MDCCDWLDTAPKDGNAASDGAIPIVLVMVRAGGCMREVRLLMPTTPPRLQYLQKAVYAALVLTDDALDCVRQQRYAAGQNIGDVLQRKNSDADGGESLNAVQGRHAIADRSRRAVSKIAFY
jgi:hypothetical protein